MRAQFLRALGQPIEDLRVAGKRMDRFREPIVATRRVEAKADVVERALEAVSLGLALVEVCVRSREEDEPR